MSQIKNKFLSQMPTLTIKGNNSGSTANPLDLTVAQVNTMLGDILSNGTVAMAASLNLGSNKIINVTDPTSAQDAATKAYVDNTLAQLNPFDAVFAATTPAGGNISGTYLNGVAGIGATFTTTATGVFTVDGTTPGLGTRIIIKNQTSGFQNGIYNITTLGSIGVSTVFTRALDFDTASDMNAGNPIPVINGTVNGGSSWYQTATITTVGTDSLVFTLFTLSPSSYLQVANNLSDVASKSTSFNNISPITTTGDLIYSASGATNSRLGIGSTGTVLTVSGGVPTWAAPGGATSYNFRAYNSSTTFSTTTTMVFNTKDYDSAGTYSTSTGIYTVPVNGKWQFNAAFFAGNSASPSNGNNLNIYIYKNGSIYSNITMYLVSAMAQVPSINISDTINCSSGDTIQIKASTNMGSGANADSSDTRNYFSGFFTGV